VAKAVPAFVALNAQGSRLVAPDAHGRVPPPQDTTAVEAAASRLVVRNCHTMSNLLPRSAQSVKGGIVGERLQSRRMTSAPGTRRGSIAAQVDPPDAHARNRRPLRRRTAGQPMVFPTAPSRL